MTKPVIDVIDPQGTMTTMTSRGVVNVSDPKTRRYRRQPISHATRQYVKERDRYRCVDCGTHLNLQIDHVVPVSQGGTNDLSNLTTRCGSCNSSKGTNTEYWGKGASAPESRRSDRLGAVLDRPFHPSSLVGTCFHSGYERGWQGVVVAEVKPGVYLVETFEWLIGTSYEQELITLEDMKREGWRFYCTVEWMNNSYEHGGVQMKWDAARKERDEREAAFQAVDPF